jgi:hypothetical protein
MVRAHPNQRKDSNKLADVVTARDKGSHRHNNDTEYQESAKSKRKSEASLAGMEFGTQCYCGMALAFISTVGRTGCTKACGGNTGELCGGSNRLSVYNYTSYIPPQVVSNVGQYNVSSCYVDSSSVRVLSAYTYTPSTNMTVENCVSKCYSKGYSKAGLEVGSECYCGDSVPSTATTAPFSDCKTSFCNANQREYF